MSSFRNFLRVISCLPLIYLVLASLVKQGPMLGWPTECSPLVLPTSQPRFLSQHQRLSLLEHHLLLVL